MEDLRKRVLFTLGMLGIYRLGIFIPAPGIDRVVLGQFFNQQQNTLFGLYDMFTGGALEQFSVFVLGIMPYITASIIMQLAVVMVPTLERIKKEGQQGQNRITQYTRYLTIIIAVVQAAAMATGMEQMRVGTSDVVIDPGMNFRLMTILTMTGGACFVMWLGEQMTDRGIGNGASIIITAGIVARIPSGAAQLFQLVQLGEINLLQAVLLLSFMFAVIGGIVFIERGQRRIPIQYAKRVLGRRVYEGQTTHLPLKVNTAGVIPPIFASSLLMFPGTIGSFYDWAVLDWLAGAFFPGRWLYNVAYAGLVVFFAFFYTAVTFNPVDVAENLKKQGGYVPRIRPGNETAEYIDHLLTRLTTGGAIYLAAVCIMPTILTARFNIPFYFGGTGLLILVAVTLDTVAQVEAHLMTRHYDGLAGPKGARVQGRRRRMSDGGTGL
ncbi:MAG: preprotein translocase subunit SecY [Deltaproteobacteria bacterium]|nr:preprotein translocase subunit SecY [Deltaproteobacteria bacterium]